MKLAQLAMLGFAMAQIAHAEDETNTTCSDDGADCSFTGCCKTAGSKCFRKNEHWSACNATCAPKRIWKDGGWQDADEKVWDCEAIQPHQVAGAPACKDPKPDGDDCSATGCCSEEGSICYKKDEHHSSCNASCTPYAKWEDGNWVTSDDPVWDCTVVKPVLAGKENQCVIPSDNGMDCSVGGCCKEDGATCFRKNEHWSSCNASCKTNMKWVDGKFEAQNESVWDCAVVYPPSLPKMPCSDNGVNDGADCSKGEYAGCCKQRGSICFKKNDHWASCMDRCWTNKQWDHVAKTWVEKDEQIWDCGVIKPNVTVSTLYEISDVNEPAITSVNPMSTLLAALAFGVVVGGSLAIFRRPQLREVPQEESAEE